MENAQTLLTGFEEMLEESIDITWETNNPRVYMESLAKYALRLSEEMIALGDYHHSILLEKNTKPTDSDYEHYFNNYIWADAAKSFLILCCNILFQSQKAYFLRSDGYATHDDLKTLRLQSKDVIIAAVEDLKKLPTQDYEKGGTQKRVIEKRINRWKLQKNPWPLYRNQIKEVAEQCLDLLNYFGEIKKVAEGFQNIQKLIENSIKTCKENNIHFKAKGDLTIELIKDAFETEKELRPGRLAAKLEDLESELNIPNYGELFTDSIEEIFNLWPKKNQIPIDIDRGVIYLREVNFKRLVKQWLESEIMPVIYEIWELTEDAQNSLKMSVFHIQNRMAVISTELKDIKTQQVTFDEFKQFLNTYFNKSAEAEKRIISLQKIIKNRLQDEFKITKFYQADNVFLKMPLYSTVNQFKLRNIRLLDKVKFWLTKQLSVIRRFQKTVEEEASLSTSEKIIRFVKCRKPDPENQYYTSIFLTKGFIGETFWVGRESEIKHSETIISNWKDGFRGAIAVTGQRLSGKSLFGHAVANRFFRNHSILLTPYSTITVSGRRMNTNCDLEEALNFIKKHTLNQSSLIWIDDLELWSHPQFPISRNIQTLLEFIDENSDDIFFLVSMSNWFKAYLNRFFDIKKAFQSEINMDRMSLENIHEAIVLRHGATHKKMMTIDGQEIPPNDFRKMIAKIYQISDGNIGEALNYWSVTSKKINNDAIYHEWIPAYALPDFIDSNTGLLLTLIMRERKTNEYHLRKLFGPAYNNSYAVILQRLLGLGLLLRLPDGMLEINEMVSNDLCRMLEGKNYLQFYNQP